MKRIKILLGLCILLSFGAECSALEIIYPRKNSVTIKSATTFFVGNSKPTTTPLTINNEQVEVHPSGGFYHPVNLEQGINTFKITNGTESLIYTIVRPEYTISTPTSPPTTVYFEFPKYFVVKNDNSPLRSTPIDFGRNRLQHLQQNIPLKIVGEQNSFYKVQLARDDFAYIAKNDVSECTEKLLLPARIENFVYEENKNYRIFKIKLDKKTPYVLSENDGLDLVIYNVKGYPENKYEFHINKIVKMFGYNSYYKNNSELIIEVKKYPDIVFEKPLAGIKIALDAGHGGDEIGTIGCLGHKEKDINLIFVNKLYEKLSDRGARVLNLRADDYLISLKDRVEMAQYLNPDIYVSIHHNAPPDSAAFKNKHGSSVFYFYHQSKGPAKHIQNALTKELGMADDGVKAQSFAVIRNTNYPAILIEVGYMTNPSDNAMIITSEFQDKAVEAIIHGLEDYLNDIQ